MITLYIWNDHIDNYYHWLFWHLANLRHCSQFNTFRIIIDLYCPYIFDSLKLMYSNNIPIEISTLSYINTWKKIKPYYDIENSQNKLFLLKNLFGMMMKLLLFYQEIN